MRRIAGWVGLGGAIVLALGLLAVACAGPGRPAEERGLAVQAAEHLSRWVAAAPIPRGQSLSIADLGGTDRMSVHVVQIRDREALHVHQQHDLVAVLYRGRGTLQLGQQRLAMSPGSVVVVPRGTPHAFRTASRDPAVAMVVFAPPFDGTDSVPVEEP